MICLFIDLSDDDEQEMETDDDCDNDDDCDDNDDKKEDNSDNGIVMISFL